MGAFSSDFQTREMEGEIFGPLLPSYTYFSKHFHPSHLFLASIPLLFFNIIAEELKSRGNKTDWLIFFLHNSHSFLFIICYHRYLFPFIHSLVSISNWLWIAGLEIWWQKRRNRPPMSERSTRTRHSSPSRMLSLYSVMQGRLRPHPRPWPRRKPRR